MSSVEFQGNGANSKPSSFGLRSLDMNTQYPKKQSWITRGLKKISRSLAFSLNVSHSSCNPVPSAMEKNELAYQRGANQNIADSLYEALTMWYDKPCPSEQLEHEPETDASLKRASEPNVKANGHFNQYRPLPFKEFTLKASDFPLTREKIAKSLSLQEGCGFLPYIIQIIRDELRLMENDLDQISVDLQITKRDAQNICFLLESAPREEPEDIPSARVQADKLVYLLCSSFRILDKLYKYGKPLQKDLQEYSNRAYIFHSGLDLLLEHLACRILDKCRRTETYV